MRKLYILSVLFITALLLITACNDDPTSIGESLIPNSDKVNVDSLTITSSKASVNSFIETIKKGTSPRLLLGKYKNIESRMLVKFFSLIPDSVLTPLKENQIDVVDSWVELYPEYSIGDSSNQLQFSVKHINSGWIAKNFVWDSLQMLNYDQNDIASQFVYTDSLITFNVNTDVVKEWLRSRVDDSLPENNGLLFTPLNEGRVLGFQSVAFVVNDKAPKLKIVVHKQGAFTDTITAIPSRSVHVMDGTKPEETPQNITLQDGLALHSKFWIDVTKIPQNSAVNKSILTFNINVSASDEGSIKTDTLGLFFYKDSTANVVDSASKVLLIREGDQFSGDFTRILQRWIDGDNNQGVRIYLTDERRALNKVVLYSNSASNIAKKPKLTVYYTEKNK
ncbi:hypothetical protein BMS3Abin04_02626 [bacterium BMS3Abin04]|nr:hypothetical protein BMS3Abin04_02626 [bacterium BMS3Abin04]